MFPAPNPNELHVEGLNVWSNGRIVLTYAWLPAALAFVGRSGRARLSSCESSRVGP